MLKLDSPRDADIHSLADYAEILCLISQDRFCSKESVADQLRDVGDIRKIHEELLDDCFVHLDWRTAAFAENYPFRLEKRVLFSQDKSTDSQLLYIALLLCANLPYLNSVTGLTDCFERISLSVLKAIWPSQGTVKAFGKNETEYAGEKWERINLLASQIGGQGLCKANTFRQRDTGDGGIDLVSWHSLDEIENRNILSALAQCACSRSQWSHKQTEISHDRLGNSISPSHRWSQLLFIPHCFRDSTGKWAVEGEIGQVVLIDRLRIVNQLKQQINLKEISLPPLFTDFLDYRLPLV